MPIELELLIMGTFMLAGFGIGLGLLQPTRYWIQILRQKVNNG